MRDKNIFGYDPKKVAREEGEKERKEWLDRQLRPPQKWGEDTSNIRETKSKFDNMPSDEYLGRKIISVKEEGHKKEDKVVHPSHYQLGELGIEAMDVMRAVMTKEQLRGFYIGNAIKYTLRAEKKNGLEDHKKARYYLDELIKEEEDED